MRIVGIDPGKMGCFVSTDSKAGTIDILKLVFNKNKILNKPKTEGWLERINPDLVIIEKVQGRHGWGATQTFSFGLTTGQIQYAVSSHQLFFVLPKSWQAVVCKGIPIGVNPKERSFAAYETMFPSNPLKIFKTRRYDNNLLDAFLISIYGQMTFSKIENFNFKINQQMEDLE